jgi:hypothetical protein
MKLSQLHENGHWLPLKGYPGSVAPKAGKKTMSFLLHPNERKKVGITQGGEFGQKDKRNRDL